MTPTPNNEALAAKIKRLAAVGAAHLSVEQHIELHRAIDALSSGQAASAVPTGSAAVRLAEQVLSMDMATPKGLRARELARQVLLQADDMLTTLRLIEHATAPTHEDGGHHENAFELSHACIERVTVHMPQPLASPTQPASAPAREGAIHEFHLHPQSSIVICKNCGEQKWLIDKYKMLCVKPHEQCFAPDVKEECQACHDTGLVDHPGGPEYAYNCPDCSQRATPAAPAQPREAQAEVVFEAMRRMMLAIKMHDVPFLYSDYQGWDALYEAALSTPPAPRAPSIEPVEAQAQAGGVREQIAERICNRVSEIPDRNSPEDWPEAMLVTYHELRDIVTDTLESFATPSPEARETAEPVYVGDLILGGVDSNGDFDDCDTELSDKRIESLQEAVVSGAPIRYDLFAAPKGAKIYTAPVSQPSTSHEEKGQG